MTGAEPTQKDFAALVVAYVAGTATDAERAAVEAKTSADADAAARLALAQSSRTALADIAAEEADEWSPGELGFRRLMRDIEREPVGAATAESDRGAPAARPAWTQSLALWRGIAAAAVLALVVVSVWRFDGGRFGGVGGLEGAGGYQPATNGDAPSLAIGALAQITFAPTATEAEIRALLLETGARLVDGPSALGLYRVAFETDQAREAGVARLSAEAAVESVSAE